MWTKWSGNTLAPSPHDDHKKNERDNAYWQSEDASPEDNGKAAESLHDDCNVEDKIDSFIASALEGLSINEREQVYYEQHGVSDIVDENPEFVAQKLDDFHLELTKLRETHGKAAAIQLAETISREYVSDRALRLKFLRAEGFHVSEAANRMIRFFDIKLYLFGEEKLCKEITISDLDYDDLATLDAGFMQLLPTRDRAGRSVFILLPSHQTYRLAENMVSSSTRFSL